MREKLEKKTEPEIDKKTDDMEREKGKKDRNASCLNSSHTHCPIFVIFIFVSLSVCRKRKIVKKTQRERGGSKKNERKKEKRGQKSHCDVEDHKKTKGKKKQIIK